MKKLIIVGAVIGLVASGLALPAAAKKAKPVPTTLYFHGNTPIGEYTEFISGVAESTHMKMDSTEPTGPAPKSFAYSIPVGNEQCVGNTLFPSWEGTLNGTIVGDVKLIGNFLSAPGSATARLWVDVPFQSCTSSTAGTDAFVEPLASVDFTVPPGSNEVEVVFEDLKVPAVANIIVEIHQTTPTSQGRIVYDAPDFASRLEFSCIPAKGAKSCTP